MSDFDFIRVAGVPILGQGIPATFGKTYFVDVERGSDSNTGLSMTIPSGQGSDGPFSTILKAYNTTESGNHDVIVMTGEAAHVLADELIVSKSRIHFVGLGGGSRYMGQRTRITMGVVSSSGGIAAINNKGVGNTFTNLKITSADTLSTSLFAVAEQGEFAQWTNCWFEKNTDLNQAGAAEVLMVGDTPFFKNCTFGNGIYTVAAARQNWLMTRGSSQTSNVARDVIAEDCIFMSRCNSTSFVNIRATSNDVERLFLFKRCLFTAVKTSPATQALAFGIASDLTDAEAVLHDCAVHNITDVAAGTKGIFTTSPTPNNTGTETIEVTTT